MCRSALALVFLIACSSSADDAPVPIYTSGSQIRAQVFKADDGFETLAGWYDPELEYTCAFDGTGFSSCPYRPYPLGFTDPACTLPFFADQIPAAVTVVRYADAMGVVHFYRVAAVHEWATVYRPAGADCAAVSDQLLGVPALEELTVIDKDFPVLTELATSDGLHFKSYVSPDGFSAVVDVLGTTTRVIDGTTTRLRNQVDQATSVQGTTVRKLAGVIDSKLDHVCAPEGGPVMQCVPYGDDVSDMKAGYVSADCTGEIAAMSPEAGVRNTYECTASTVSTVYVSIEQPGWGHPHVCQGIDVTGFSQCAPLTDLVNLTLVTE